MFLGQFFVKNARNDPRALFKRPKLDKIYKPGKCRNLRKQRKKWLFSTFKTPKLGHFSRYLLEILYMSVESDTISVFSHTFQFFFNLDNFLWISLKIIFLLFIFLNFQSIQNIVNPRLQFDRDVYSQPSVENRSVLSLKLFA